jgi:hypothetical protein
MRRTQLSTFLLISFLPVLRAQAGFAQPRPSDSRTTIVAQASTVFPNIPSHFDLTGDLAVEVGRSFSNVEWTAIRFSALIPARGGAFTRLDTGISLATSNVYFGGGVGVSRFDVSQGFVFARLGYALLKMAPIIKFEARYEHHNFTANGGNLVSVGAGVQLR